MSGAGEARKDRRFFCLIYRVSDAAARANWLHSPVHKASTSKSVSGFFRYSDWLSRYRHLKLVQLKICESCCIFQISKFSDILSFAIIPRMFWRNLTKIGQIHIPFIFAQISCIPPKTKIRDVNS